MKVDEGSFDEAIKASDKPVVVDFWAEWCGPCKMIAPVLEELASQTESVQIAKLNVDENPEIARRYSVMSIPTLLVFVEGVEKKRIIGAKGKGALLSDLQEFVG
jgi:thioredoxin 1